MARPISDLREPMEAFDEFLEVWERPMEIHTRTIAVHVAHPSGSVEMETTHKYGSQDGLGGEVRRPEEIFVTTEEALGDEEADMEAKEAALS